MDRVTASLAADSQALERLRYQARQQPEAALRAAARQFETVFLDMMLKAMREATPQDGWFDSEQSKLFTGMLDQQLAQVLSARGIGLAEVMVRQLMPSAPPQGVMPAMSDARAGNVPALPSPYRAELQQGFVARMRPYAEAASRSTGIPAHLIVAQAALESGWGQREIKLADGRNSHNLFGIKAGADWQGAVAEVTTTEYRGGVAHKRIERFRAYASYAEAFDDYAVLLRSHARYAGVLGQSRPESFALALQQAGYATDPHYADKLLGVIGSVQACIA